MADGASTTTTTGIPAGKAKAKARKVGLLPPPRGIEEALDRIASRGRREAVREGLYRSRWTLRVFWKLSAAGQAAVLSALAFCSDPAAVENLFQEEARRDLDPISIKDCERVARDHGLAKYALTNYSHRTRVSCGWARRQHYARAGRACDEARIASDEPEAEREEREAEKQAEVFE